MRKLFQTMRWLILILALIVIAQISTANGQTKDFADDSRTTTVAGDCLQKLDKTLDALESAETIIDAKTKEIAAKDALNATNEAIIGNQKEIISQQEQLIAILMKQSRRKFSILFGLVKVSY